MKGGIRSFERLERRTHFTTVIGERKWLDLTVSSDFIEDSTIFADAVGGQPGGRRSATCLIL